MLNPTSRAHLVLKGATVLTMASAATRAQAVAVLFEPNLRCVVNAIGETIEEMGVTL